MDSENNEKLVVADDPKINGDFIDVRTKNYTTLFSIPEVSEYYTYVASAISLAHYYSFRRNHEMAGVHTKFRFKSHDSIEKKLLEYIQENKSSSQPIFDCFAMTMITDVLPLLPTISDTPTRYTSEDGHLRKLIDKKFESDELSQRMQEFKSRFVDDDSFDPVLYKQETDVTQEEYYSNCLEVLLSHKNLINPAETDVIAPLDSRIDIVKKKLELVRTLNTGNMIVPNSELVDDSTNFVSIFRDFEKFKHRELAVSLLAREAKLVFQNPIYENIFNTLGVNLSADRPDKNVRKPNGYESNFRYLTSLFGDFELQLQTNGQYDDGKIGNASHGQYKMEQALALDSDESYKDIVSGLVPIPSPEQMQDAEVAEDFETKVKHKSPRKYKAEISRGRVELVENGLFDNYHSIYQELPVDSPFLQVCEQYFSILDARDDSPLNKYATKVIKYYTFPSIQNYLLSDRFQKVLQIQELWDKHPDDFARAYELSELNPNRDTSQAPGQMQFDFEI